MTDIIPILPILVGMSLIVFIIGLFSRKFKQPHVISYIIAGLLLGPSVFGILKNDAMISDMGSMGMVFLLFFIGMEIDFKKLLSGSRVAFIGTVIQLILSVLLVWIMGYFLGWNIARIVLIGFVIMLSSTAVVLKVLEEWNETDTHAGRNVISILLMQDLIFIPMTIVLEIIGGETINYSSLALKIVGMILMSILLIYILRKKELSLPFADHIKKDHEMQVFLAMILCFGMSLLSGLFGLSIALGAFIAGIVISATKETKWVHDMLNPFRIFFVALFFIYVGVLIDLSFLLEHRWLLLAIVGLVFFVNTIVNAVIIRLLNNTWADSFYAGALLSQLGEFGFLLAAIGLSSGVIAMFDYQMVIQVIALTLLFGPLWILIMKRFICHIERFSTSRTNDGLEYCKRKGIMDKKNKKY